MWSCVGKSKSEETRGGVLLSSDPSVLGEDGDAIADADEPIAGGGEGSGVDAEAGGEFLRRQEGESPKLN